MSSALHEQPYLESWRWMSRRIRCAMSPDEPRLIEQYLAEGRYLARCTATSPWMICETAFRLLLDTASDVALPWHWRTLCLDQAWRPLRDLERQSLCRCRLTRWQRHAWALATCVLEPSICLNEPVQGFPDE
ncbi:FagA protein [Pseudomonas sp. ICMP22404]|uniref:FagA protein n=1 Tax=Pseudomonas TaxID=286 RepID=UPI00111811CD|nr:MULTISPECIES: FagA protein [Pseudomonas]MCI0994293.1 FagA protein [Pseudomonas corrugata]NUT66232.1 FagA protein [Pseudomonas corrugata]TNF82164.1 FagA protein [Pseudomonas sp. ICMP22404]